MKLHGLWLALALWGCGPTVGDPCTTAADCLGKVCINRKGAPGGYCSTSCALDNASSCPTGTVCIRGILGNDVNGCMRLCTTGRDCRAGYVCEQTRGSDQTVCTGGDGF